MKTTSTIKVTGAELRDDAEELLKKHRGYHIRLWQRTAIRLLLAGRPSINSDDLHKICPVPKEITANFAGTAFSLLAKAGIIREIGREKTGRATSHARKISCWALDDRAKAHAWLAENAERKAPAPLAAPLIQTSLFSMASGVGV